MGSILRYSSLNTGGPQLLFAGPGAQQSRKQGTVRLSQDGGKTWPVAKIIHEGGYAYSCLTELKDGSVGLLFEKDGYTSIAFTRFTLDWLTDGRNER